MVVLEALQSINVSSKDLKVSQEFYTNFLDFEVVGETLIKAETSDSILLNFQNIQILLFQSEEPYTNKSPFLSFILDIDDFTDAIQEIENKNVPIVDGPKILNSGETIHISDPSGNVIEFYYCDED